jgi:hypothetical protein
MAEIDKTGKDNQETYAGFLGYAKWLIVFCVVVLAGLLMFVYHSPK